MDLDIRVVYAEKIGVLSVEKKFVKISSTFF